MKQTALGKFFRPALPHALAAAVLLAACSPQVKTPELDTGAVDAEAKLQRELAVRSSAELMDRMYRVAWNIRAKNVELCGERVYQALGLTLLSLDDYKKAEQREAVQTVLSVHSRPTVYLIGPGGPADVAGLKRGDAIMSVDGENTETKKRARELLAAALKSGRPAVLEVKRDDAVSAHTLTPMRICGYPVRLDRNTELNAFADGDNIILYMGMLKFVKSDDELAAILGHEMAHNTQKHSRNKTVNAAVGHMLVDLPIRLLLGVTTHAGARMGGQMFSPQYETEADYVGLYYTARAGYDIHNVADVWRRMSVEYPDAITLVTTHPSNSQRFVGLAADAAEIDKKRAEGLPLVPEMKNGPVKADAPAQAEAEEDPLPPAEK